MTTPILLVEDDPHAQDVISALCNRQGYAADVAGDAFLGLRLLSERRHAIVLIDYHLPEMDGYALARLMREIGGSDNRPRLVGITADAHGLASRRGADSLFDAILAKPIAPEILFSTLDRLSRPEVAPPVGMRSNETPADALWRRRGLPHRPRAILCAGAAPTEIAAVAQAFDLVAESESCDLVLLATDAGLAHLRALRAEGPARLVPAIDLTGRLAAACDHHFVIDDSASWTELAELCIGFAQRRAALSATAAAATDVAGRLIALLHVSGRNLVLPHANASVQTYETGHAPVECMQAVLVLMQAGFMTCEPTARGLDARLTERGHRSLAPDPYEGALAAQVHAATALSSSALTTSPVAIRPSFPAYPIANDRTMTELRGMIGDQTVTRLHERLVASATEAFAPDASLGAIAHDAHILISMAGTLGFERLSEACRLLQTVIAQGGHIAEPLAIVKEARTEMQAWRRVV